LAVCYGRIGDALVELGDSAHAIESHQKAVSIYQSLSEADPANAVTRRDVGDSSSGLAKAFASAASQSGTSIEKQNEYWRQARLWYQRALDVFVDLRSHGTLRAADADQPEKIATQISRCDKALARLEGVAKP
jgi:hypothetical protein